MKYLFFLLLVSCSNNQDQTVIKEQIREYQLAYIEDHTTVVVKDYDQDKRIDELEIKLNKLLEKNK